MADDEESVDLKTDQELITDEDLKSDDQILAASGSDEADDDDDDDDEEEEVDEEEEDVELEQDEDDSEIVNSVVAEEETPKTFKELVRFVYFSRDTATQWRVLKKEECLASDIILRSCLYEWN